MTLLALLAVAALQLVALYVWMATRYVTWLPGHEVTLPPLDGEGVR